MCASRKGVPGGRSPDQIAWRSCSKTSRDLLSVRMGVSSRVTTHLSYRMPKSTSNEILAVRTVSSGDRAGPTNELGNLCRHAAIKLLYNALALRRNGQAFPPYHWPH